MVKQIFWWLGFLSLWTLFAYSLQHDRQRFWLIDTAQGRAFLAGLVVLYSLYMTYRRFRQKEWLYGALSLLTACLIAYNHLT